MRKFILSLSLIFIGMITAFSQTASPGKDSLVANQKFYFPATYYTDSIALEKAMPELAAGVAIVYHDENRKKYFENATWYYLLAEDYTKATEMLDSLQKIDGDMSNSIELKSYVLAKNNERKEAGSFENSFKKEFSQAFNRLSFRKKAYLAMSDSSSLIELRKDYSSLKERLHKDNKDSLGLEDARSLCENFANYTVYNKIYPLMSPFMTAEYRPTFPAIKSVKWAGVVPVKDIDELPDPAMQYKLLFELTGFAYKDQDSTAKKEINMGLGMVARQLNLHEANGIPRKNIHPVVVVHGSAIYVFLNNEKYRKKYGIDNPNILVIKELQDYGISIIACGQLMTFTKVEREDLVPGIKQALTAQTVISSYQLKGYVYYDLSLTE